jgi:two-component system cell cycle sensor histidine kinase/response regulator CckA
MVSLLPMASILIVEDEDMLRGLIRELLEIKGYYVLEASHGVEALEAIRNAARPVDLVLTDVVMPQMSGSELVEKLKQELPGLKVIFMSGYTGANNAAVHKNLGMPGVAFLQKPFRLNALIGMVEGLLGGETRRDPV